VTKSSIASVASLLRKDECTKGAFVDGNPDGIAVNDFFFRKNRLCEEGQRSSPELKKYTERFVTEPWIASPWLAKTKTYGFCP